MLCNACLLAEYRCYIKKDYDILWYSMCNHKIFAVIFYSAVLKVHVTTQQERRQAGLCHAPPGPWHNEKKCKKNVKITVFRLKWSVHIKKGFATCHFSIILFSLRIGVVHILYFLAQMQVFCCLKKFFITNNVRRELSYTHHFNFDPINIREVEKLQYRCHNTFHKAACARVTQLSNLGHDIFKNVFAASISSSC